MSNFSEKREDSRWIHLTVKVRFISHYTIRCLKDSRSNMEVTMNEATGKPQLNAQTDDINNRPILWNSLKTEIAPYSRNELIERCALAIMVDVTLSIGVFTIAFHRCLQMSIRSYVVSEHRL